MNDRRDLAKEIVREHVPPAMASVVLEVLDEAPAPAVPVDDQLLTIREVTQRLGGIHPSSVYRMIERGELAALRIGSRWRVRESVVREYCEVNEHQATPPTARARATRRTESEQRIIQQHDWLEAI